MHHATTPSAITASPIWTDGQHPIAKHTTAHR